MWIYNSSTGKLYHQLDPQDEPEMVAIGYSGFGSGRNNPLKANIKGVGPIPGGYYSITLPPRKSPTLGPLVMDLEPHPDTETFGRSLFRIHGDNSTGTASHGCIIVNKKTRELIEASKDIVLKVV